LTNRPLGSSLGAAALVVALFLGLSPVAAGAARAADPGSDRSKSAHSSDASAPGGRLIVFWKTSRKPNLALPLVAAARASAVRAHRSVVTAAPGQAAALAARLRADPDVAAVVPDLVVTATDWPADAPPNDPEYGPHQADLPLIGMPAAWATTTGSPGVVVAILDTGTTVGHPDLAGTTFVDAYDFVHATAGAVDDQADGHGTHVTGTIAGRTNNSTGIAGMAPGLSIMPLKVLDYRGRGNFSDILDAIDYARVNGATVISMSLGAPVDQVDPDSLAALQTTINRAYLAGITIVAAAGNHNVKSENVIEVPCAFAHVICVGATDDVDAHATFSNTNAYVDISAPGVAIWSTVPTLADPSGYLSLDGTSMATPHVAALAGLIRAAHPLENVDQVEATILSTAVDLGDPGRDDLFGAGRINVAAAVNLPPPDLIFPAMTSLAAPELVTSANRAFSATWTATDNVAVTGYEIRTRKDAGGAWSAVSAQTASSRTFLGLAGGTWYIGVRAVDAAGHRSAWQQAVTIVPKDDRSWSFSSGMTRRTGAAYFAATDTQTSRSGSKMTVRFTGSSFYLIGTAAVHHGKLRVTIDGHSWIVDEGRYRGSRATRTTYRVVILSRTLGYGAHTAVITCLATSGRPVIDVDAVAWRN
jgi:subtilisin family serine protease